MKKVFLIGVNRTPIEKMGGALSLVATVEIASIVIKEILRHSVVLVDKFIIYGVRIPSRIRTKYCKISRLESRGYCNHFRNETY